MTSGYLLVRSWPADPGTYCTGRHCGRALEPGETISCVAHAQRARDTPNADDARAYLCTDCVAALGTSLVASPYALAPRARRFAGADAW